MRAARYHEYGTTQTLVVEDAPEPHPGPDEIRVRVAAAGVNPVDWKVRSGGVRHMLPVDLPAIPGREVAGVVDEIGADVRGVGVVQHPAGHVLELDQGDVLGAVRAAVVVTGHQQTAETRWLAIRDTLARI